MPEVAMPEWSVALRCLRIEPKPQSRQAGSDTGETMGKSVAEHVL